jgi:hypothetical protein
MFGCAAHELRLLTDRIADHLACEHDTRLALRHFCALVVLGVGVRFISFMFG